MEETPLGREHLARHWDGVYTVRRRDEVSWFQPTPALSLELIEALEARPDGAVIDVGGGTSTLVDHLVQRGFTDISVLDVSVAALADARRRLGQPSRVSWICQDLRSWRPDRPYDLWHDRAVFHFLTTEADRSAYLGVLRSALADDGALIMATFAEDGPEQCSGLPVARYSAEELSETLGSGFSVVQVRRELHTTPSGIVQPFTWIAARRGREG